MKNKINFNIIKIWIQNQKYSVKDCGPFLAVYGTREQLELLVQNFKTQFPDNKIYINDEIKDNLFISIDK